MMVFKVCDRIEEVKLACHFLSTFGIFGVRIVGVIHYFQYPNSFNKKFSELNFKDDIIIRDH